MSDSAASRPAPHSTTGAPQAATFAISRLAYLTVLVTLIVVLMMIGISPAWFGWTVLVPIVQIWWIARVRTEADRNGLEAMRLFGSTRISWDDVAGLRFPKWSAVKAVRPDGGTVSLPAVTFADLPALSAISGGRVPDPYAAAREAALAEQLDADDSSETDRPERP